MNSLSRSKQWKERGETLGSRLQKRETKPNAHAQLFISRGYVIGNVADSRGRVKLKTSEKGLMQLGVQFLNAFCI